MMRGDFGKTALKFSRVAVDTPKPQGQGTQKFWQNSATLSLGSLDKLTKETP